MKSILLIVVIGFSTLLYGQVPTVGLIGRWEFSGNANDLSSSANHGTVMGASLVSDRCGNTNSAYSFNGITEGKYDGFVLGSNNGTLYIG